MSPFPGTYTNLSYSPHAGMQAALTAAVNANGSLVNVPITVVALGPATSTSTTLSYATYKGDDIYFTASLAKVAAMYSAFELRRAVRDAIPGAITTLKSKRASPTFPASALADQLKEALNPTIVSAATKLPLLKNAASPYLAPANYTTVFDLTPNGASWTADFTASFSKSMEDMIVPSNNSQAAACVHGVSYGYINAALTAGGFFDPTVPKGIWLAGDYLGVWPYYRIQSVNDAGVGQAGTTFAFCNLYAHLARGFIVDSASSAAMMTLLAKAYTGLGPDGGEYFLDRASGLSYQQTHTKVGLAPLKSGADVSSEASILKRKGDGALFAASFQNLTGDSYDSVAQAIDAAVKAAP